MFGLGDINSFLDNLGCHASVTAYTDYDYIDSLIKARIDSTIELERIYEDYNPSINFNELEPLERLMFRNMLVKLIHRMVEDRIIYLDFQREKARYNK